MRLLDRYLFRELIIPLGYCLCGFLILWIFSDLFLEQGDFRKKALLARDIVEYYVVITPAFVVIVLPIALLLALLYSLTNLARHNEITAIRAAGVSLWRLSWPCLGVGLAAATALFVLNEFWVPYSDEAAEQILARRLPPAPGTGGPNIVRHLGFTNSRDGRIWQVGIYNSVLGEMIQPQVVWTRPDGSRRWLAAERALYTNDVWTFFNLREYTEDPNSRSFPVPSLQTNKMAIPEFRETPEQIRSEIRLAKGISLQRARSADVPIKEILNYLHLHPKPSRSDRSWLYTKLHARMAAPWTCLVVVLIAIPFSVASGRRNIFVGVAGSILICFIFFVLQQLALAFGTGGHLPSWLAAWLPNLSFGVAGVWLTARVR